MATITKDDICQLLISRDRWRLLHFLGLQLFKPPSIARSIPVLHHSLSSRWVAEGRRESCPWTCVSSYSKACNKRGIDPSVCEAPIREPSTTAEVIQRYMPEKATLCTSTLGQLFELGSDEAALMRAMSQPPMKNISATNTGRDLVALSAAKQFAVSS
jgi:hypothetical protein